MDCIISCWSAFKWYFMEYLKYCAFVQNGLGVVNSAACWLEMFWGLTLFRKFSFAVQQWWACLKHMEPKETFNQINLGNLMSVIRPNLLCVGKRFTQGKEFPSCRVDHIIHKSPLWVSVSTWYDKISSKYIGCHGDWDEALNPCLPDADKTDL